MPWQWREAIVLAQMPQPVPTILSVCYDFSAEGDKHRVLENAGYAVIGITDAAAAFSLASSQSFDGVVLGPALTRHDRALLARMVVARSNAPIVSISGRLLRCATECEARVRYLASGDAHDLAGELSESCTAVLVPVGRA